MRRLRSLLLALLVSGTAACEATRVTGHEVQPPPPDSAGGSTQGSGG